VGTILSTRIPRRQLRFALWSGCLYSAGKLLFTVMRGGHFRTADSKPPQPLQDQKLFESAADTEIRIDEASKPQLLCTDNLS